MVVIAMVIASSVVSVEVRAQSDGSDAAARQTFERGRAAFEVADYERALIYFRHAYRLSQRPELQYNIGVAASRLQREDEALEAFERYLTDTEDAERELEVKERIEALRASLEEREATERALADATVREAATTDVAALHDRRLPKTTIAGGSALAAVGVAGASAMAVGLARDGSCKEERDGACVTERSATTFTYVYGAVGLAALAGSATWFAISHRRRTREGAVVWRIRPGGLEVSGTF